MEFQLQEAEQKQLVIELYDCIAAKMGVEAISVVQYDCRYIEVAENVMDNIKAAFYDKYPESTDFDYNTYIMRFGPKMNSKRSADSVLIEPRFIMNLGE